MSANLTGNSSHSARVDTIQHLHKACTQYQKDDENTHSTLTCSTPSKPVQPKRTHPGLQGQTTKLNVGSFSCKQDVMVRSPLQSDPLPEPYTFAHWAESLSKWQLRYAI